MVEQRESNPEKFQPPLRSQFRVGAWLFEQKNGEIGKMKCLSFPIFPVLLFKGLEKQKGRQVRDPAPLPT
jgi:hypothetical protein